MWSASIISLVSGKVCKSLIIDASGYIAVHLAVCAHESLATAPINNVLFYRFFILFLILITFLFLQYFCLKYQNRDLKNLRPPFQSNVE